MIVTTYCTAQSLILQLSNSVVLVPPVIRSNDKVGWVGTVGVSKRVSTTVLLSSRSMFKV